jgi:hypothetical protein
MSSHSRRARACGYGKAPTPCNAISPFRSNHRYALLSPIMERLTNKQHLVDSWLDDTVCGCAMNQLRKTSGPEVTSPRPKPPWKIAAAPSHAAALDRSSLPTDP